MPTSFVGLLLFGILLAPGLSFQRRRAARRPVQKVSEQREIASVVLVSGLCDAAALCVFGAWRTVAPGLALDAGRLVREGGAYVKVAYVPVLGWLAALLALACGVAFVLALAADSADTPGTPLNKLVASLRGEQRVVTEPAWWRMFANRPDDDVYAGCVLDDGTYLGGYVYTFSAEADETSDRELVLTEPETRGADGTLSPLGAGAVVISARRVQYLTVTYLPHAA